MSRHPVKATWKAEDDKGNWVLIWLESRRDGRETWRWSSTIENYYGWKNDWETSYRACVENAPCVGRFRRIQNKSE